MKKKNLIKVPKDVCIVYSGFKKIITVKGPVITKSLKLKLKLNFVKQLNLIEVTTNLHTQTSKSTKKQLNTLQGTTVALIKQVLLEVSSVVYKKLKFVGVGYRAFTNGEVKKLLVFKLGYSHLLYYRIPVKIKVFCLKFTKLFVFGNSYQNVSQTASTIRSYKKPEPYKGKGILYENEKILLKEGKKI